jgi:hypothetical protein
MATITFPSTDCTNWQATSDAPILRVFYSATFTAASGIVVSKGSPRDTNSAYKSVTTSLSGTTVTIPSFTILSTRDGLDNKYATVSFHWFRSDGSYLGIPFGDYVNLQVPALISSTTGCVPSGTCCLFSELKNYNGLGVPIPEDARTYSDARIDALIQANIGMGGITGTGANTRLPFFTSTTAVSTNTSLTWNNSTTELSTNLMKMGSGTNANDSAWSNLGASATMVRGADSTSASSYSGTLPLGSLQTWRSGNNNAFGFLSALYKVSGQGDTYGWYQLLRDSRDYAGLPAGSYNNHGFRSYVYMNPTNIGAGVNVFGYNLFQSHRAVTGIRAVGAQIECGNLTTTDCDTDATTQDSTIGVSITGAGTAHNSVAILVEANNVNAFATVFRPITDSVYRYGFDFKGFTFTAQGTADFTQNSAAIVGGTSGSHATRWLKELVVGDQISVDGVNWYTVATVTDDNHATISPVFVEPTATTATILKTLSPFRISAVSYITARNIADTANFRVIGVDPSDHVRLDPDGKGVYAGSTPRRITDALGSLVINTPLALSNGLNSNITVDSGS